MAMNEREHHIKVLEQFLHDYQEWGEDLELEKTIKYAISSLKTDLKYDLMYEGEDVYTKADMRAKVIIYDDENNDCPKGAYELDPYDVQDNGISTKYLFEFEYNKVNRNLLSGEAYEHNS